MSDDQVRTALAAIPSGAQADLAALLANEPVGRLFDGAIVRWIVKCFGGFLQGLTEEQIAFVLVASGIPHPWAGLLAKLVYDALHQTPAV